DTPNPPLSVTWVCERCGNSYSVHFIAAIGHIAALHKEVLATGGPNQTSRIQTKVLSVYIYISELTVFRIVANYGRELSGDKEFCRKPISPYGLIGSFKTY